MKPRQARTAPNVSPSAPEPVPSELPPSRERALFAGTSVLLLAPCFWQSRLQIGDLESHIYNAWLAQLIESGRAPGLTIVSQKTNVLFDWILSALFRSVGAGPAQRIAVALCVLVFAWGAFAFICRVSGRRPWHLMPLVGVLSYGWTLHMGFLNFYLSLGLCLWAMALAWNWKRRGLIAGALLVGIACVAHTLPVMWAAAITIYAWLWRRTPFAQRAYLMGGALAAVLAGGIAIRMSFPTLWFGQQLTNILGVDQARVFGGSYQPVMLGLVLFCAALFFKFFRQAGFAKAFWTLPVQIWLMTLLGILVVPNRISIPGYQNALMFIANRMSLAQGVCLCAVLAMIPAHRFVRYGLGVVALLFFALLYRDESVLNGIEDRMEALVRKLPPNSRVVSAIEDPYLRVNALTHMIDRICVGHCYSYANYEPSTDQFRIRVTAPNPIVAATYADSFQLQTGGYVVKERDAPLFQVRLNDAGGMEIRELPPGTTTTMTYIDSL
jgi:hypothetical protein